MNSVASNPNGNGTNRIVFYNTGGRVSEIKGLQVAYAVLDGCAAVHILGKGRKERSVPLWRLTVTEIRKWLARTHARPDQPLFPGWSGTQGSGYPQPSQSHLLT